MVVNSVPISDYTVGRAVIEARCSKLSGKIRPQGYKTSFILNLAEHEILNAHQYKNNKNFSFFLAQISL